MVDPYELHRIALAPLLPGAGVGALTHAYGQIAEVGEERFLIFLAQQGLGPLWHSLLQDGHSGCPMSAIFHEKLRELRLEAASHYLLQKAALTELRATLDDAGIVHFVYKGAATREQLHHEPALRPAADIDLLVAPENRDAAINTLVSSGFTLRAKVENVSHEVNLQRGALTVDLHWDLLRPGRTRRPMPELLLQSRKDHGDHWAPAPAAALFIALVHPVFAKHACAPQSTLIRVLDLCMLLHAGGTEAKPGAYRLLEDAGLQTAAWLTLYWLALLTEDDGLATCSVASTLLHQTAPGRTRLAYLKRWVEHNGPDRLKHYPMVIKLAFTCAAHDRPGDALGAMRAARKARRQQEEVLKSLELAALTPTAGELS